MYRPSDRSNPAPAGLFARTVESSLILRPLRELCRDSLVWALLVRLGRSFSGRESWIGGRFARHAPTRDFPGATAVVRASVIFGGIDRWFAIAPEAWRNSVIKDRLDRTFGSLEAAERVRHAGYAIVSAAVTNALLDSATLLSSWRAEILLGLAITIGLFLVVACRPLAAAWQSRR